MTAISSRLRAQVVRRAGNRCEYCSLSQVEQEAAFHIDHVVPQSGGGPTIVDNLALACVSCSLKKWARQAAIDPQTGEEIALQSANAIMDGAFSLGGRNHRAAHCDGPCYRDRTRA